MFRAHCYSIRNSHKTVANACVSFCNLTSSSTFTSFSWKSFLIFKHHLTTRVLAAYKFCAPGPERPFFTDYYARFSPPDKHMDPSSHTPFPNLLGPKFPERRHLIVSSHLSRLLASTTSFSSIQHPLNHRFTLFYLSRRIKTWIYCKRVEENTAEYVMCWYTEWRSKIYAVYSFKYNQQDTPLYKILNCCQGYTCFRRFPPIIRSSKTVTQHLV